MTIEEIRQLIQLAEDTGVAELEVQRGENRVRIRRMLGEPVRDQVYLAPVASAGHAAAMAAGGSEPRSASAPAAKTAAAPQPEVDESLVYVRSPIVGTFYEASAPGSPPFVHIGDRVQPGKVLCIIESMKLMNEIECEVSGVIEGKLVQNGQPVEYGEALFAIRPI
jgi:acetyl-CoA carboxylase biotin carboxyl carrier protein